MINMKMTAEEAKEMTMCCAPSDPDAPAYPWGLCVSLDDDSLTKLGMTSPPAVGTKMLLTALVEVTSASESQRQGGDKEARCELQITDMELGAAPAGKPDPASVMYANSGMNK